MDAQERGWRAIQVRLDGDLYEWLRAKSFYERRSMHSLVLEALMHKRTVEEPLETWHDRFQRS